MDIIFDIGANEGKFTDVCLIKFPNAKIIVIEPNNYLYNKLIVKYSNNKNIIVLDYLVSTNNDELLDFYISNASTISTASTDFIHNSRFSGLHEWYDPMKKKTINL